MTLSQFLQQYGLPLSATLFVAVLCVVPHVVKWAKRRDGEW